MKRSDRLKTAMQNLRAGKRSVIRMVIGITIVIFFILSYILVLQVFENYQTSTEEKMKSLCYRFLDIEEGTSLDVLAERVQEGLERIQYPSGVMPTVLVSIQPVGCHEAQGSIADPKEMDYLQYVMSLLRRGAVYTAGNVQLDLGDITYEAKNYTHWNRPRYKDLMSDSSLFRIGLYDPRYNLLPERIFDGAEEALLAGSLPESPGELLVDEYLLTVYNVEMVPQELVGKTITIYNKAEGKAVLREYRVSGVLKNEVWDRRESDDTYDLHSEHICAYLREEDAAGFEVSSGSLRYYYPTYGALTKNIDNIGALMMNQVEWTELDASTGMLSDVTLEVASYHWVLSQAGRFLCILGGVAIMAAIGSAGYLLYFYRGRSRKFYTMLDSIGMRRKDRMRICRSEILLIMGISTVMAIYLLLMFWFIFRYVIHNAMHFTPAFPMLPLLLTLIMIWSGILLLSAPFSRFRPVELSGQ
ncbi:MAG: ABC transporter permease [Lachnospiraceae bacterium]|nr:ABC transporter permease [Lachnospiraceae bacterium]